MVYQRRQNERFTTYLNALRCKIFKKEYKRFMKKRIKIKTYTIYIDK